MYKPLIELMRINRPAGYLLLLAPMLWGILIASQGQPDPTVLLSMIAGAIVMRSAGCVANDIADRQYDRHVKRTQSRPLAARTISLKTALTLLCTLMLVALCIVLTLNTLTIKLSVVALLLTLIYPFMKRITYWPQLILGLAFSWGGIMGFAATSAELPTIAWILFAASTCWTWSYDTSYAISDLPDDKALGLKSSAIFFEKHLHCSIALAQCLFVGGMTWLGIMLKLSFCYYISLLVAALLFMHQHTLLGSKNTDDYQRAFKSNQLVGMSIVVGLILHYHFCC